MAFVAEWGELPSPACTHDFCRDAVLQGVRRFADDMLRPFEVELHVFFSPAGLAVEPENSARRAGRSALTGAPAEC